MADELLDLRKKAEAAVADMADGELKTKAFEVILNHLLSTRAGTVVSSRVPAKKPSTISKDASRIPGTAKSRILLLKDEGFFSEPRSLTQVRSELRAHGWIHPQTGLSGPLQSLVQERRLRRMREKVKNKTVWHYVNP